MTVIRCETCKGTGKVMQTIYVTNAIGKMFEQPKGFIGANVETTRIIENHAFKEEFPVTCHDCGGSGCKWVEVNNAK